MAIDEKSTRPRDPRYLKALDLIELRHVADESQGAMESRVRAAIQIVEDLLREDSSNADHHFLLGYAWYNLDDAEPEERARSTQQHLREALRLDPNHFYSRLYLAHELFDEKHYREARDNLEWCETQPAIHGLHAWQRVKVRELLIACQWYLEPRAFDLQTGMRFVDGLCDLPEDERPRPTELIECVDSLLPRMDQSTASLARQLREMLALA